MAAALITTRAVGQETGEAPSLTASAVMLAPLQLVLLSLWQQQVKAAAGCVRRAVGTCCLISGDEWNQSVGQVLLTPSVLFSFLNSWKF